MTVALSVHYTLILAPCKCQQRLPRALPDHNIALKFFFIFFLSRDRSSTKCPLRVHIAGHGSVTGPTLGMGLV